MNIFNNLSYRDILKDKVKTTKRNTPGMGLLKISKKAGLYGSFLSSVLKGNKHLSQDQLYSLGTVLRLSDKELNYLLLLLNYERASNSQLKERLQLEIDKYKNENKKTTSHINTKVQTNLDLNLAEYYSDPYYKIIHVFLGVEHFNKSPSSIAKKLNLSLQKIEFYLEKLEKMSIIKIKNDSSIEILKKNYHLPKDSFICNAHQAGIKLLSQNYLFSLDSTKKESVSVTFSGDSETFKNIHNDFLVFLKKAENHVKQGEPKEVFQMNFDLHHWS